MPERQKAKIIFCGVPNNEKDPLLLLFATTIGHCYNNCIDANKAVRCFHMFTSAFCKSLVQTILRDSILYYPRIKRPRKGTERILPVPDPGLRE